MHYGYTHDIVVIVCTYCDSELTLQVKFTYAVLAWPCMDDMPNTESQGCSSSHKLLQVSLSIISRINNIAKLSLP